MLLSGKLGNVCCSVRKKHQCSANVVAHNAILARELAHTRS